MKSRVILPMLAVLLAAVGTVFYAWVERPKLIEISPQAGAEKISATASIRLVFSRPMNRSAVTTRLAIDPVVEGTFNWDGNSLVFTPTQPWVSGTQISVSLKGGSRAVSWLAFPMDGKNWSFTTSAGTLAYLWPSDGPADIYALDPVTGGVQQYTQSMNVLEFIASRDGRWLYFSSGNAQAGADLYEIDRMKADAPGGQAYLQKLLECGAGQCRNPAISADGKSLAVEYLQPTANGGLGPAQVWTLQLTGLAASAVGQAGHETVLPDWSPTGLLAYYDRSSRTYEIYNPATQARVQLPNQTGQPGSWSPDGKYYLAAEMTDQAAGGSNDTGSSRLIRYSIQDRSSQELSGESAVEDVQAAYSPDGGSIAFTRKYLDANRWSPGRQMWLMNADGSNPHMLSDEADYNHYDLAWSRDGMRLAYVRFNQVRIADPPELWMIGIDGSNPLQLVIGGYSPIWIP